ncbi:uncharacterized protein LOC130791777 isoform X5 [Actinidia eriantha]|nr:uncharacterized protein LOC130791777 isoform X5 [Actinidia eriantha]XP_057509082.1 uncharacterized protein LOC130791777 isoform X5 [Actinidia eriantha]
MRSSSKYRTRSKKTNDASNSSNIIPAPPPPPQEQMGIEMARLMDTALPHKIWLKQQFSIGVNDVTRVLERMPPIAVAGSSLTTTQSYCSKAPAVQLQAILLASDCNPRCLTKHLPSMASSRKVPLLFVKDKKGGSVRLGELAKLKTAIAIGVKVKGNAFNQLIEEILHGKLDKIP